MAPIAATRNEQRYLRSLDETHTRRIEAALKSLGIFCALNGLGWLLFFGRDTNAVLLASNILTLITGLAAYLLTCKGRTRLASYLLFSGTFTSLSLLSLYLDVPSPLAPRVSHYYFLVVALCSYWVYEYESKWLRYGISALALLFFIVFASTTFGLSFEYRIPDEVRVPGSWVNSFFVVFILGVIFYVMQSDAILRVQFGTEISDALNKRQFELYYQPQVNSTSHIFGCEALLRWHHPTKGIVPPLQFIPFAEAAGLMVPLGYWVLEQACRQLTKWQNGEMKELVVSVNVSVQQFNEPDFVEQVKRLIEKYGIKAGKLNLELTESIVIQNTEQVIAKMHALRAMGIGISLDDFGTGYSSLGYLRNLPLDQLKIDKMFVQDILVNPRDVKIANHIIHLAKDLGHSVIAEGVETEAQREFLLNNGCELFQGFLFSQPLPATEFERHVLARYASN